MSDEIKVSRPAVQSAASDLPQQRKGGALPWVILAVVVAILVVLGVLFRENLFGSGKSVVGVDRSKASGYQAVFLTNGQVYFGKMSNLKSSYVTLTDIYYLQVIQQQPLQGTPQEQQQQQQAQQQISLVKLGNELHGPVDEMHISQSQILFYEDLKEDGNVVQAIQQYKANPQGGQQAQ